LQTSGKSSANFSGRSFRERRASKAVVINSVPSEKPGGAQKECQSVLFKPSDAQTRTTTTTTLNVEITTDDQLPSQKL